MSTKSRSNSPVILLFGPTGVGKTDLVFTEFSKGFEIISADSMQVYRGMDIGSAKPDESLLERIPHHLIDIHTPDYQFNVGEFVSLTDSLVTEILGRGKIPLISGGTAFYFINYLYGLPSVPSVPTAVRDKLLGDLDLFGLEVLYSELKEIDPVRAAQIHFNDKYRIIRALEVTRFTGKPFSSFNVSDKIRPGINPLVIGLTMQRQVLYERINRRVDKMFKQGLVEEVKKLIKEGYIGDDPGMKGIGYGEFFIMQKNGELTISGVAELIKQNSRRYAKRQLTFFKKIPGVRWFTPEEKSGIRYLVDSYLDSVVNDE